MEKKPSAVSFERAYANMTSKYVRDASTKTFVTMQDAQRHQDGYPKECLDKVRERNFEWERTRDAKV